MAPPPESTSPTLGWSDSSTASRNDKDNIIKQGIALVQTIVLSHTLLNYFNDKSFDDEILVECKFHERFKKWEPVSLSDGPIDEM